MPVRQSWVESVLASGGYGSSSFQLHLLLVAARWATCASSSRSRRYSIPTAQLYSMHVCTQYQHSTVRKALRRSCTISRFLEKLHELRFASPTLLPRLLYSTIMYHIHRPRIYCLTVTVSARCVSHSVIHVTYGSKPQIGKTSVAHTAAQTEPGEHRRPF